MKGVKGNKKIREEGKGNKRDLLAHCTAELKPLQHYVIGKKISN